MAGQPPYIPTTAHFEAVEDLANKGATHKEMAKALGISAKTFQRNTDLFGPYIKKGRDKPNEEQIKAVEDSLHRKALGYSVEEVTTETRKGANGNKSTVKKVTNKYHPASDTAIIFYLVNKKPESWRSINKDKKDESKSFGEIQSWFQEMDNSYNDEMKNDNEAKPNDQT